MNTHRNCLVRHVINGLKPTFTYLLFFALLIKMNYDIAFLRIKISGRIIKGNMAVFPNPYQTNINWRLSQFSGQLSNTFVDVPFSANIMSLFQRDNIYKSFL